MARWIYANEHARRCSKCGVMQIVKIDRQRRVQWYPWACECGRSDQPDIPGAGKFRRSGARMHGPGGVPVDQVAARVVGLPTRRRD